MNAGYIAIAIPFFFLLIGVEYWVGRRRGLALYRFSDSIADLCCGIGSLMSGALVELLVLAPYAYLYQHHRLWTQSAASPLAWLLLLLGVDLGYYAYHLASHRCNFFWATHVVHHQSEEYNLSVALRQSWLTGLQAWIFYLPLALLGFPMGMFLAVRTLNTLYQFWIHTRAVGRLGPLEWVLNTPSHHRVHHGINPRYLDKNYAGIFIIWDRLFGTFTEERGEPVYGTVQPLASWSPLWANLAEWVKLGRKARATGRLRDKLRIWLMPPEWQPADLGGPVRAPEITRAEQRRYDRPLSAGRRRAVLVLFVVLVLATTVFMVIPGGPLRGALGIAVTVGLLLIGPLLEGGMSGLVQLRGDQQGGAEPLQVHLPGEGGGAHVAQVGGGRLGV